MKRIFVIAAAVAGMYVWTGCRNANARYLDLSTGERVELVKDESTGLMVDAETKKPVYIYVDTKTNDTIYGRTGKVINGYVVNVDGKYKYDNEAEYNAKSDDYKKEVEKDGDVKIKNGDKKVKIDGETGEKKVKKDD
jgi:hypothetical protein